MAYKSRPTLLMSVQLYPTDISFPFLSFLLNLYLWLHFKCKEAASKARPGQIMAQWRHCHPSRKHHSLAATALQARMECFTEFWNNEGEIETWGSEALFRGFNYFCFPWVLTFQRRKVLVEIEGKENSAKQKFHIRWRFSSFQEGVRVAKKH